MPKAARERVASPRAGTALAPQPSSPAARQPGSPACIRAASDAARLLWLHVTNKATIVNGSETTLVSRACTALYSPPVHARERVVGKGQGWGAFVGAQHPHPRLISLT